MPAGESHILVATDAIGMGLNLPIRRVLFSTMSKFDGVGDRALNESEVHQIAGRAGRYGIHEEGFTGVLHEAEAGAGRALEGAAAAHRRAHRATSRRRWRPTGGMSAPLPSAWASSACTRC